MNGYGERHGLDDDNKSDGVALHSVSADPRVLCDRITLFARPAVGGVSSVFARLVGIGSS